MGEPLKIVHVITGLNPGGAETWLVRLLGRLPAERFDSRVVSLMDGGDLSGVIRSLGVPVTVCAARTWIWRGTAWARG